MALTRVWTGLDLNVDIFRVDSRGNRLNAAGNPWVLQDGALLRYCIFQRADVTGALPVLRRPVTGRPYKRISGTQYEYEMSVEFFYANKGTELNLLDIFNRDHYLEIVMTYEDPANPSDSSPHTMSICKGDWKIATEENGVATGSAKFVGERFS